MEWLKQLNDALDYIEEHLDGELSLERAAQLACCSPYHFQRMFSYIAGVPLSEYLRRRRMTSAAFDLQQGEKVIDTALRYGYESPTAFNRAFQSVHGISPSAARKAGASLKAYPRIRFQITIRGETEMDYRIVKKEAFRIVGVKEPMSKNIEENFSRVPIFWQETALAGKIPQIASLMEEPMGILGVSNCCDEGESDYYIAAATTKPVPEGMDEYIVPACTWAIFSGSGSMPEGVQELEKRIVTEWLPTSGYEWGNAPDIELYLDPDNTPESRFEVWLPVVLKETR